MRKKTDAEILARNQEAAKAFFYRMNDESMLTEKEKTEILCYAWGWLGAKGVIGPEDVENFTEYMLTYVRKKSFEALKGIKNLEVKA